MSTRKIKNAKDLLTDELIYFKGHAQATFMSNGLNVEEAFNNLENSQNSAKTELLNSIAEKQDIISDLDTIRSGALKGSTALQNHQDISHLATKQELEDTELLLNEDINSIKDTLDSKQNTLISGTNIKTVNGESILGSGDITIGAEEIYEVDVPFYGTSDIIGITTEVWNKLLVTSTISAKFSNSEIKITLNKADLGFGNLLFYIGSSIDSITGAPFFVTVIFSGEGENFVEIPPNSCASTYSSLPISTSQLENDSNFVSSDGLKTINGESIVGSGDIEVGKTNYVELSGASVTINSMLENTFYYDATPLTSLTISAFTSSGNPKGEYKAVFKAADGMSLTLPSDVYWANGTIPDIEANVLYELSIERGLDIYKAVLVPFKTVE